jgi:ABC-type Fe3+ transport system permease subunit
MSTWEIIVWMVWIIWGLLAALGIWIMHYMDKEDRYELPEDHWRRQSREATITGQVIIWGWVVFSVLWIGFQGTVIYKTYNLNLFG